MSKLRFTITLLTLLISLQGKSLIQARTKEVKEGTATISGRVMLKGEPARGVVIALQPQYGPPSQNPGLRVKTNNDGSFRITSVPAGHYVLGALAPGFVTPGDNPFGLQGRALNVSDGENIENIEFELKRGGVITGRITNASGRPLVDESVSLMRVGEGGRPMPVNFGMNHYMITTDDRGIYRLYGVPEGNYAEVFGIEIDSSGV